MKLLDILGVASGIGAGVLGLTFAPPPKALTGSCPWSEVFPIYSSFWRFETYDGCHSGFGYVAGLMGYLAVVFFVAGALASRIAVAPSALRGACVGAVVMAAGLVILALISGGGFAVAPTLVVGVVSVAGAAGVGFLGGPQAKTGA